MKFEKFTIWVRLSLESLAKQAVRPDARSIMLARLIPFLALAICAVLSELMKGRSESLSRSSAVLFAVCAGLAVISNALVAESRRTAWWIGAILLAALPLFVLLAGVSPGLSRALPLWLSAAAGLLVGPALVATLYAAAVRYGGRWRVKLRRHRPNVAAADWFVRLHSDAPDQFDWTAFDAWVRQDRAHRIAYDRVEALWYGAEGEAVERPRPRPALDVATGLFAALISPAERHLQLAAVRLTVVALCLGIGFYF